MRYIKAIILHCSESDRPSHNDISVIKKWHLERGFNDVGYHYFIQFDGNIQEGRPLRKVGAHCKGKNRSSIGICLAGKVNFTELQFISLNNLIRFIQHEHEDLTIKGHNFYNKKKLCPRFDVAEFKLNYNL